MQDLKQHAVDTLVHIGAGLCQALSEYSAAQIKRIVLIEPNPTLANQLRKATDSHPSVEVWELAVTDTPENAALIEYNWPEVSSLRQASGLKKLFPGLKTVRIHDVAALTPMQMMEKLGLTANQPHHLVIEACGEEGAIIKALAESQQLALFTTLAITTATEALYEGATDAQQLLHELSVNNFDLTSTDQADPDFPCWYFARNPAKQELEQLKVQLDISTQQLKEQNQKNTALTQQNQQLQSDLNSSQRSQDNLSKQLQEEKLAREELVKQQLEATINIQELQVSLEQLKAHKATLAGQITKQDSDHAELTNAKDELGKQLADKEQQLSKLNQNLEAAQAQQQEQQQQLSAAKNSGARLEMENQQYQHRQNLLQEELVKAEAQIELIKDLVLREPSL